MSICCRCSREKKKKKTGAWGLLSAYLDWGSSDVVDGKGYYKKWIGFWAIHQDKDFSGRMVVGIWRAQFRLSFTPSEFSLMGVQEDHIERSTVSVQQIGQELRRREMSVHNTDWQVRHGFGIGHSLRMCNGRRKQEPRVGRPTFMFWAYECSTIHSKCLLLPLQGKSTRFS